MSQRKFLVLPLVLILAVLTASFAAAAPPERTTIVDIALDFNNRTGEFSNLLAALTRVDNDLDAGLIPALDGNRQFTVFAPTDAAFDAAGQALGFADGADLVANVDANVLLGVLTYHVSPGNRPAADVLSSDQVRTLSKGFVFPYIDGSGLPFLADTDSVLGAGSPDAQIIQPNVFASNGVIHIIDWVLLP
ncbi:MAG: fasciclin domain-containing protein [Candidatus Promineifilaceae bacterium]